MFRGSFEHNSDEKGRLAVPSSFRKLLCKNDEPMSVVITSLDECLLAYPMDKWEQLEEKLAALPQFDAKVSAFQRVFIGRATECPIDKAGRILIPTKLRSIAEIDKECYIVGNLTKFEIWAKHRWVNTMDGLVDNIPQLVESMSDLGIHL